MNFNLSQITTDAVDEMSARAILQMVPTLNEIRLNAHEAHGQSLSRLSVEVFTLKNLISAAQVVHSLAIYSDLDKLIQVTNAMLGWAQTAEKTPRRADRIKNLAALRNRSEELLDAIYHWNADRHEI